MISDDLEAAPDGIFVNSGFNAAAHPLIEIINVSIVDDGKWFIHYNNVCEFT